MPKIDMGNINHILTWDPDKDNKKKGIPTGSKDSKVSTDPAAKPTTTGVAFKTSVEDIPPEKEIVPPAGVEPLPESREVPPVRTNVSVTRSKSSASEHFRSPRAQKPSESRTGAALGTHVLPNSSTSRALDHYRSPKRQQLDPSAVVAKNYADLGSPSSVSSSSSPPVASMSSASSRDALESLTSRVVVRPSWVLLPRVRRENSPYLLCLKCVGERSEVY